MFFKEKIHAAFLALQREKIDNLKAVIEDLAYSISNETKSTAGDKHETALAHLQTAVAQTIGQLQELTNQYNLLKSFDPQIISGTIRPGSLVGTNNNYLYITAAAGKATVDTIQVHAVSAQSPVAVKLLGKIKGDNVEVNGRTYEILEVC